MLRTWTNNGKFTYAKSFHYKNNSKTKSFQFNETYSSPCPIRPSKSIIPKDINLQKIFKNMLSSSYELSKIYSNLVTNINIDITSRKKIFKKIREFFISNLIEYKIYFKTILLFDIISIECENNKLLNSIEEIALGALILSVKFNYDENKMFSMKKFLKFYCEKVYTLNDIIDIERKALITINYFLNYTSPMCFLEFFILNGIIYNTDNLNENDYHKIYSKTESVLEKIMEESNNYLKYNFFYLACSIVSYCRQIYHLEKWPFMLKKVFSIDFYIFQNEYNVYFSFKEKDKDKEIKAYINKKNSYNCTTYNCHTNKDIIINGNNNVVLLDLKNLNNSDRINEEEKGCKNNNFNIYKKNNFKTINHYNNIINININNVSVNSINNIYNSKTNKNINSNRFHYNSSINTINDYSNKNTIQRSVNIFDGIYKKSISKNKYKNKNDKNYKSTKNLEEIKEVKDYIDLKPYVSPNKRKRKHYYINRIETTDRDNVHININENKKSENYNIIGEVNEETKNNNNYKRNIYINNNNNILKDRKILSNYDNIIHFYTKKNNSLEKKEQNYLYDNKNNNNSNENSSNNITEGKIDNANMKYSKNINIKEYNSNNNYNYDENKNETNIIKNKFSKNINDSEKSRKILNYKCQSSRIGQSYIKTKNNLNGLLYTLDKEKYNKINNETEIKSNIDYKNNDDFKEREKERKNKRIKIENKIKYNDLIKYKLAMSSYSINKRK